MPEHEYSIGDRVWIENEKLGGEVVYADPTSGGVIRWDDGDESEHTWDQLGAFLPEIKGCQYLDFSVGNNAEKKG